MQRRTFLRRLGIGLLATGLGVKTVTKAVISSSFTEPKRLLNHPANTRILGYRGNDFLDAGYVYVPYIPLHVSSIVASEKKGTLTRYPKLPMRYRTYTGKAIRES